MSFAQFDQLNVLSFRLTLPIRGAWYAEVELDATPAESPVEGAMGVLSFAGRTFAGHVVRPRDWHGRTRLFFEAGVNGMRTQVEARQFESTLVGTAADLIVTLAGETLAADRAQSTQVLNYYSRALGAAGSQLSTLLRQTPYQWRFNDKGEVWYGEETWPSIIDPDATELEPFGESATSIIDCPTSALFSPGQTFEGRRIERAVYELTEEEGSSLTCTLTFARDGGGDLKGVFGRAVKAAISELPYLARYPGRVVRQLEDRRIEMQPDSTVMAGSPPAPALYGLPGVRCEMGEGSRAGLVYEAADPTQPRIFGWEENTPVDAIKLDVAQLLEFCGGTQSVHRVNDTGSAGALLVSGPGVLVYVDANNIPKWTMTLTSATPGSPVGIVIAPIEGDPGALYTKALTGAEKVKA